MDAPPIQYARTEDGVNIAYWAIGEGPPLVFLPSVGTGHAQVVWEYPEYRDFLVGLGRDHRLIYMDHRGTGLSSLDVDALAVEGLAGDIEAVAAAASPDEPINLFATANAAACAARYAVRHPTAVQRLVLFNPWLEWEPAKDAIAWSATFALIERDLDLWLQRMLPAILRAEATDAQTDHMRTLVRMSQPPRLISLWLREIETHRLGEDAAKVATPTLVIGRRDWEGSVLVGEVAAAIRDARYVVVDGDGGYPFDGAAEPVLAAVHRFLGTDDAAIESNSRAPSGMRTLLFTDLESSTALTQSVGDAKAQEVLRGHDDAVRTALETHGGEEVKHTGDGIFAAFGSAVSAVEAALRIQHNLAGGEVRVRIGLNAGEPIQEDDDYFGSAVQLAARVCDRAEPGQVLVSQVVRDLCRGKTFTFADQGETTLKGFPEPVRLFAVGESG